MFKLSTAHGAWGVAILAVGMAMIGEPAAAQSVTAFTTWALGPNALGGLIGLGLALVGVLLMFGQHTWTGIVFAIVGAVLVGNAVPIGGMFGGGGGGG